MENLSEKEMSDIAFHAINPNVKEESCEHSYKPILNKVGEGTEYFHGTCEKCGEKFDYHKCELYSDHKPVWSENKKEFSCERCEMKFVGYMQFEAIKPL